MKLCVLLICVLVCCTSGKKQECVGSEPYIFLADYSSIKRVELDGSVTTLVSGLSGVNCMGYDADAGYIFYGNYVPGGIYRAKLDGTDAVKIVSSSITKSPNGMAVDRINKRVYWTDQRFNKIHVTDYNGNDHVTPISSGLSAPRAIALDIPHKHMYWIDWHTDKLERANLDGTNRITILNREFRIPSGLTLDVPNGKIYFSDVATKKLERCNLDGSNRETIIPHLTYAWDIFLHDGYIYWGDTSWKKIERVRTDGTGREVIASGLSRPYQLHVVPGNLVKEVIICSKCGTLKCPKGYKIDVLKAFFGRIDDTTCPGSCGPTNCIFSGASTTVQALCNGKQTCRVHNNYPNSFPTDPCPSVSKYTKVKYRCCKKQVGRGCRKTFSKIRPVVGGCRSKHAFFLATCRGRCESRSRLDITTNKLLKKCTCCQPVHPFSVPATIDCGNGKERAVLYTDFAKCECVPCKEQVPEPACSPETVRVKPVVAGCEVDQELPVRQCRGNCPSLGVYLFGSDRLVKECLCCVPDKHRWLSQTVKCKNGKKKSIRYQMVDSCRCEPCESFHIPDLPVEAPSSGGRRQP